MKKNFTRVAWLALCMGLATPAVHADDWTTNFDDAESLIGTSHKDWSGSIDGIQWTSYAMRCGSEGNDFKNGKASVRIYGEKMSMKKMPFMEMAEDKVGGIGTISFVYRAYGTHEASQVEWIVQVSKDAGAHWVTIGEPFTPGSESQTYTVTANYPEGRMRIVRADYVTFDPATARSFKSAFNIDDMSITDSKGVNPDMPEIMADQVAMNFGEVYKGSEVSKKCSFSYQNLTEPIKISFKEETAEFRVNTTEITPDESGKGEIEVTYCPTSTGEHMAYLLLTSGDVTSTVVLQGSALRRPGEYTFSGGTGTETDPYQMAAAGDFLELSQAVVNDNMTFEGKYFKMTKDVDLSTLTDYVPIGNNHGMGGAKHPFMGTFDGDGHTVSNLKVSYKGINYMGVGLFGLTQNAVIKGVTIINSEIRADAAPGALAGVVDGGQIVDCHVGEGVTVTASHYYAGGLVGCVLEIPTLISDCSSRAEVINTGMIAGGILGGSSARDTKVIRCINYGDITSVDQGGGVVGYSETGIMVADCANLGNVSISQQVAGGIIASINPQTFDKLVVKDCYNYATMFGAESAMPITIEKVMSTQNIEVENCYYCSDFFSENTTYGTPLTESEMQSSVLLDRLNRGRDPQVWNQDAAVNNGLPVPANLNGSLTAIGSVTVQGEMPTVSVENGRLVVGEGFSVVRVHDAQGKTFTKATTLPAGVYVVVLVQESNPMKPYIVKVVSKGI